MSYTTSQSTKKDHYERVLKQVEDIIWPEAGWVANMANISALLYHSFPAYSWVGFYMLAEDTLWVGPYQGKLACTKIEWGQGVCGTAVVQQKTQCVEDVAQLENHIYCDPDTQSEIVVPLIKNQEVIGVLDIDSHNLGQFDQVDQNYLEKIVDQLLSCLMTKI